MYSIYRAFVAFLLGWINPRRPLGTQLFDAVARVSVTVAVETVAIRRRHGHLEVFLRRRSLNDTAYPGEWHSPGRVMRPGESVDDVFYGVRGEYHARFTRAQFVGNLNHQEEVRGHFFSPVYLVDIEGLGRRDKTHGWFRVDKLPQPMVRHHEKNLFPMAIAAFEEQEGATR